MLVIEFEDIATINSQNPPSDRYSRQRRFGALGDAGQARLEASRVLVCGCGALGSIIAERLARAGVGYLRIVDRDWVELSNLARQTLFTEKDAADNRPKAVAAAEVLRKINSSITIEPVVEDVTHRNIRQLATDCNLILDGTDNFETRLLINDFSLVNKIPWVHGGCLGASGQVMSIIPGQTACFRCLVPEMPPREAMPTCDTAGVLGPAVGIVASWQAAEALKILSGHLSDVCRELIVIDSWHTSIRLISLASVMQQGSCAACHKKQFPFLDGKFHSDATVLCGKNAVQVAPSGPNSIDLDQMARHLSTLGGVVATPFFLRLTLPDYVITLFRDGRAIISGTSDPAHAKSILARTLGG